MFCSFSVKMFNEILKLHMKYSFDVLSVIDTYIEKGRVKGHKIIWS